MGVRAAAAALLLRAAAVHAAGGADSDASVHVVFCAECKADMDWKSAGMFHSWHTSGMPGRITRLLACSEEQLATYPKAALEMGPTFVHRNYRTHPRVPKDFSGSYNKAASIMEFMAHVDFSEQFVLYVDADMLIRRPLVPSVLGVQKGTVVSEHVMYLENGVNGGLIKQFSPEAKGVPAPVGWYHFFHRDDIAKIAPLWLHYCERMRTEPELYWKQYGKIDHDIPTGDAFVRQGGIPWISEMYGYVIAAAEVGVSHVLTHGVVKYAQWPEDHKDKPDWIPDPYIIHNGIGCHVNDEAGKRVYGFEKSGVAVDPARGCELDDSNGETEEPPKRRLMPRTRYAPRPPPFRLGEPGRSKPRPFNEQLCIWATNMVNNALCGLYRVQCGRPAEECPVEYANDGQPTTGGELGCEDKEGAQCAAWAAAGECGKNQGFMREACRRSCHMCAHVPPLVPHPEHTFNGTLGAHLIHKGMTAAQAAIGGRTARDAHATGEGGDAAGGAPKSSEDGGGSAPAGESAPAATPAALTTPEPTPTPAPAAAEQAAAAAQPSAAGAAAGAAGSTAGGARAETAAMPAGSAGGAPAAHARDSEVGHGLAAAEAARDGVAPLPSQAAARMPRTPPRRAAEPGAGEWAAMRGGGGARRDAETKPPFRRPPLRREGARVLPDGEDDSGDAERGSAIEEEMAAATRIQRQMLAMWGVITLCLVCCIGGRAMQVRERTRARERKRRMLGPKHAV